MAVPWEVDTRMGSAQVGSAFPSVPWHGGAPRLRQASAGLGACPLQAGQATQEGHGRLRALLPFLLAQASILSFSKYFAKMDSSDVLKLKSILHLN